MPLQCHIGKGWWFGGCVPTVALALAAARGDIRYGLWDPIIGAVMTQVIGTLLRPETRGRSPTQDDEARRLVMPTLRRSPRCGLGRELFGIAILA